MSRSTHEKFSFDDSVSLRRYSSTSRRFSIDRVAHNGHPYKLLIRDGPLRNGDFVLKVSLLQNYCIKKHVGCSSIGRNHPIDAFHHDFDVWKNRVSNRIDLETVSGFARSIIRRRSLSSVERFRSNFVFILDDHFQCQRTMNVKMTSLKRLPKH